MINPEKELNPAERERRAQWGVELGQKDPKGEAFKVLYGEDGNGRLDIEPHDPSEIIGDHPGEEIPGILQIPEEKKGLIETLKEFAMKNDKRVVKIAVITAVGVGLTTILGVGSYAALKHFIDKNPEADITDK